MQYLYNKRIKVFEKTHKIAVLGRQLIIYLMKEIFSIERSFQYAFSLHQSQHVKYSRSYLGKGEKRRLRAYIEANRRNIENPLSIHNRADINNIFTKYLLNSIL